MTSTNKQTIEEIEKTREKRLHRCITCGFYINHTNTHTNLLFGCASAC